MICLICKETIKDSNEIIDNIPYVCNDCKTVVYRNNKIKINDDDIFIKTMTINEYYRFLNGHMCFYSQKTKSLIREKLRRYCKKHKLEIEYFGRNNLENVYPTEALMNIDFIWN